MKYILEFNINLLDWISLSFSINNPVYVLKKAKEELSGLDSQ